MYIKSGQERNIEKVQVTRFSNVIFFETQVSINKNKIVKDYVYSPQARIIA